MGGCRRPNPDRGCGEILGSNRSFGANMRHNYSVDGIGWFSEFKLVAIAYAVRSGVGFRDRADIRSSQCSS
jgi:hypothetical protein